MKRITRMAAFGAISTLCAFLSTALVAQAFSFTRFMDTPYPKNTGTSGGDLLVADLNGDGKLDIAVTGFGGKGPACLVYIFDPKGYALLEGHGLPGLDGGSRIAAADFDRDGDLDIALTGKTGAAYQTALMKIYKNDGNAHFTEMADLGAMLPSEDADDVKGSWGPTDTEIRGMVDGPGYSAGFFEAVDLNGDAFSDLVFSGGKGIEGGTDPSGMMIQRDWEVSGAFLGDGKGGFALVKAFAPKDDTSGAGISKAFRASGAIADFDGDGKPDIVLNGQANRGPLANQGIPESQRNPLALGESFKGQGNGGFSLRSASGLPSLIDGAMWAADINGDRALDLGILGNTGTPKDPAGGRVSGIWLGKGDGTFALDTRQTDIKAVMSGDGAFGDLDGDGDLDMAVIGNDNDRSLRIYENKGGIFAPLELSKAKNGIGTNAKTGNASPDAVAEGDLALADLDGDGDLDIVLNGRGGSNQLLVFLNGLKK